MKIENAKVEKYYPNCVEDYRSQSLGGSGCALHEHVLVIDGVYYVFIACGGNRWVFKSDTISFEYRHTGKSRHILKDTMVVRDKNGKEVIRGNRSIRYNARKGTNPIYLKLQHDENVY